MNRTDSEAINAQSMAVRDAYRDAVRQQRDDAKRWQHLKHQHPFHGLHEMDLGGAEFLMFSANDDQVVWEHFWTGAFEAPVAAELSRMAHTADVFLDIGAYTGCMALMAATLNPACQVHCFEPMPRTVERLEVNVKVNQLRKRITIHPVGASDSAGDAQINMPRPQGFLSSGNSLVANPRSEAVERMTIRTVRLDDYLKLNPARRVSALKLDVEGHELSALHGMAKLFTTHRPEAVVEVWPAEADELFELFERWGYQRRKLTAMDWLFTPRT